MSFRGKLCVSLAKKNAIEEERDEGGDKKSRPLRRNISSSPEVNPGYIEVPLEFFQEKSNLSGDSDSNKSSSICSNTTDCGSVSEGLPALQMTPSPNIPGNVSGCESAEILPIPKMFVPNENYLSEQPQISKEDRANENIILGSEAEKILSAKKMLFVEDNMKTYAYLENLVEPRQPGSTVSDERETVQLLSFSHVVENADVFETSPNELSFTKQFLERQEIINCSDISEGSQLVENLRTVPESVANKKSIHMNTDKVLHNFGNIVEEESNSNLERIYNHRRWTKKTCCPYCYIEVTHFPRHLQRRHGSEGAVREISGLSKNDPQRKILLDSLRRQGNYVLNSQTEKTRPVRRPRSEESRANYFPCNFCLGFFKKQFLGRHKNNCKMNKTPTNMRNNHLSESQAFYICAGQNKEFYDSLRLKTEVLNKMRVDEISKTVMEDVLICSYGESQLKRHKRVQLATMVSNKMRELGRLLIVLKRTIGIRNLIDALKPEFFDNIVTATKIISGYDEEKRNFKSPSLALHMSTRLTQVCDIATKLIIKKCRFIHYENSEDSLKNIKRFKMLVGSHFNSEVSSLALKDLNEKQWEKPKTFPLTSELQQFQIYVMDEANKASKHIKANQQIDVHFRKLTECVMALTLLINRKRIGEVQFLKLETYTSKVESNHPEEFLESLTKNENILTKHFKRVVTGGKGSKPVAILFPKKIQLLIDVMLSVRSRCVPESNEYLFANPKTTNRWLSGYHILKKLADLSGVENKDLFTSTRLRKQIATVLQVMNVSETEMEQFANFMGHTKKTHDEYYRLPQDIFQTAKVSKILIAINKGKGSRYKGKSLDEINLSDIDSSDDSDHELTNIPKTDHPLMKDKSKVKYGSSSKGTESVIRKHTSTKIINEQESESDSCNAIREYHTQNDSEEEFFPGSSSSDEDHQTGTVSKKRKSSQRQTWSKEQSSIVRKFFAKHIKEKIAPKKKEVELLKKKYSSLFKDRNWVIIKAYVYNCYRKK